MLNVKFIPFLSGCVPNSTVEENSMLPKNKIYQPTIVQVAIFNLSLAE